MSGRGVKTARSMRLAGEKAWRDRVLVLGIGGGVLSQVIFLAKTITTSVTGTLASLNFLSWKNALMQASVPVDNTSLTGLKQGHED